MRAGELVTYTITITNDGPSAARSVDVKDQLPVGLSLVQAQASDGGVCGGTVCQFGTLSANATRTVTVTARVDSDVPAGQVTNMAAVYSTDESVQANNVATATTEITTAADIRVSKVDLQDPVAPGGGVLYQIVVANDGPSDAQNVVVTDTLASDVIFSGASPGCVLTGNEVVCTVATLPANSTQTFFIAVTAKESAVSGTVLDNQVVATSATLDPTPVNTATVTTTVAGFGNNADVGIVKTQATSVVTAGERITYTLTVTNSGPSAATNVRVLDLVPAGTTVVSMTAANPDYVGEFCSLGGSCYLGTVFTGTTALITVVLQVNADFAEAAWPTRPRRRPTNRIRRPATTSHRSRRRSTRPPTLASPSATWWTRSSPARCCRTRSW